MWTPEKIQELLVKSYSQIRLLYPEDQEFLSTIQKIEEKHTLEYIISLMLDEMDNLITNSEDPDNLSYLSILSLHHYNPSHYHNDSIRAKYEQLRKISLEK